MAAESLICKVLKEVGDQPGGGAEPGRKVNVFY